MNHHRRRVACPRCRHAAGRGRATTERADDEPHALAVPRRAFLATAGGAAAALAGCAGIGRDGRGGDDGDLPDPVSLGGGKQCDTCGMVIGEHPGPSGQIFYREHAPTGHDDPARFDSVRELFAYHFDRRRRGWEALVVYVTDYSVVDYSIEIRGGTPYLSSHVEPGAFADARGVVFVVGSEVHGAMGPDLVPFSTEGDAEAFAAERGGEPVAFDDVDAGVLSRIG